MEKLEKAGRGSRGSRRADRALRGSRTLSPLDSRSPAPRGAGPFLRHSFATQKTMTDDRRYLLLSRFPLTSSPTAFARNATALFRAQIWVSWSAVQVAFDSKFTLNTRSSRRTPAKFLSNP